jgi:hypothetical protein
MSWITRTKTMNILLGIALVTQAACIDEPELGDSDHTVIAKKKTADEPTVFDCRLARIAAERAPLYAASLGRIGATAKEQKRARRLLQKRAKATCKGIPRQQAPSFRKLTKLVTRVEQRFAKKTPELQNRPGLFLEVLIPDLADFERRCFDADALDPEELEAMTDAEFDDMMDELSWGLCGSSEGAAPGGDWAAWSSDARAGYADCVREGIRDHLNDASETCNIAGGGQTDGSDDTAEPSPDAPQPDQDGDDDPNDGPAPDDGSDDGADNDGSDGADNGPAGDLDAEQAGALGEIVIGAAGAITGAAVAGISIALAPETLGTSLVGLGAAAFLVRQGWHHYNRGIHRLHLLCPSFATNAGRFGYAGREGADTTERAFSVADVMHQCRCEFRGEAIDTDPTGELGDDCTPGRSDRLDCIRNPYDETGRLRRECADMMTDDNGVRLSERLGRCAAITCRDGLVPDESCNCVNLGGGTGGGGGGGFDPCETASCPPGSLPVPAGATCLCEDAIGSPGGPDIGGPGIGNPIGDPGITGPIGDPGITGPGLGGPIGSPGL